MKIVTFDNSQSKDGKKNILKEETIAHLNYTSDQ